MSGEEKDRLLEILFYLYFNNVPEELSGTTEFWNMIRNICALYRISDLAIVKAVRILMVKENIPTDEETYYLLNEMGLTVRPLRTISGIYWQKQKVLAEKCKLKTPTITRRVTDIVIKKSIRDFILAVYKVLGTFSYVDINLLEEVL